MSTFLLLGLESFTAFLHLALMLMTCQESLLLELPFLGVGALHVLVKTEPVIETSP